MARVFDIIVVAAGDPSVGIPSVETEVTVIGRDDDLWSDPDMVTGLMDVMGELFEGKAVTRQEMEKCETWLDKERMSDVHHELESKVACLYKAVYELLRCAKGETQPTAAMLTRAEEALAYSEVSVADGDEKD